MLTTTERQNEALADAWLKTTITYKIEWDRELERRERQCIIGLMDQLLHPDHVQIDMNTGLAQFTGPATREKRQSLISGQGANKSSKENLSRYRLIWKQTLIQR